MRDAAWIDGIDDSWARPEPPKRKCANCPTLLRRSNPDRVCEACKRRGDVVQEAAPLEECERKVQSRPEKQRKPTVAKIQRETSYERFTRRIQEQQAEVCCSLRMSVEDLQKLSPKQVKALMCGIAEVLSVKSGM